MLHDHTTRDDSHDALERRAAETMLAQTQRLNRMITALLDVSRIESGRLSLDRAQLDLVALTRRVVHDLRPMLSRHDLQLDAPAGPIVVEGDELRLEQVLQNLIQNAIKYSPYGGPIHVGVQTHGASAQVSVRDVGIGIPAESLPHIFDRFYRARNAETWHITGMGMGLFLVQEILALHGGTVQVESTEGQGSTFTITLPQYEAGAFNPGTARQGMC